MYGFEKLEVWQKTRKFVKRVYEVTASYPKEEQFGLIQHTRKSAVSILSSIAEGSSRFRKIDFKRFIQISIGSLYETITQLFIALDNGYLTKDVFNELYNESQIIAKMLSNLSKSQSSVDHKL
ncbi:MAG: four helix bundle protein [candidate division WOR-3 bacterium]